MLPRVAATDGHEVRFFYKLLGITVTNELPQCW